jgi:hypothetical protein
MKIAFENFWAGAERVIEKAAPKWLLKLHRSFRHFQAGYE